MMALDLDGIAVSSGSACSSGTFKPSHVLMAMGVSEEDAKCALRISIGWATTQADIDRFLSSWEKIVKRVRS
jgi:cysteine desulfurase